MGRKSRLKKGEQKTIAEIGILMSGGDSKESKGCEESSKTPQSEMSLSKSGTDLEGKGTVEVGGEGSGDRTKERMKGIADEGIDLEEQDIAIRASRPPVAKRLSWADEGEEVMKDGQEIQPIEKGEAPGARPRERTYADAVAKGNRDVSNGWRLVYDPPKQGKVTISMDEWNRGSKCWEHALVGYVLGTKPGYFEMSSFAKGRWRGTVEVKLLRKGVFLYEFKSQLDLKDVLEAKWTFRGRPLILQPWSPDFDPDKLEVTKVPVWVQFPKLHLSLWNPLALGRLASALGKPLATDKLTAEKARFEFARVLIEVEIQENPPIFVPVELENGRKIEQEVIFEWMPTRCVKCKGLGHIAFNCSAPPVNVWVEKKNQNQQKAGVDKGDEGTSSKGTEEENTIEKEEESKEAEAQKSKGGDLRGQSGEKQDKQKEVQNEKPKENVAKGKKDGTGQMAPVNGKKTHDLRQQEQTKGAKGASTARTGEGNDMVQKAGGGGKSKPG